MNPFLPLYVETRNFLLLTTVCGVRSRIELHRKKLESEIPLLPSESRESVAEMQRNGSKRKCRFMQITSLIHLTFLAGKSPVLE